MFVCVRVSKYCVATVFFLHPDRPDSQPPVTGNNNSVREKKEENKAPTQSCVCESWISNESLSASSFLYFFSCFLCWVCFIYKGKLRIGARKTMEPMTNREYLSVQNHTSVSWTHENAHAHVHARERKSAREIEGKRALYLIRLSGKLNYGIV